MPISNSTQEDGLPSDLAVVRIHLKPLRFLSLGSYERLNQKKHPATISQIMDQIKELIDLIDNLLDLLLIIELLILMALATRQRAQFLHAIQMN